MGAQLRHSAGSRVVGTASEKPHSAPRAIRVRCRLVAAALPRGRRGNVLHLPASSLHASGPQIQTNAFSKCTGSLQALLQFHIWPRYVIKQYKIIVLVKYNDKRSTVKVTVYYTVCYLLKLANWNPPSCLDRAIAKTKAFSSFFSLFDFLQAGFHSYCPMEAL